MYPPNPYLWAEKAPKMIEDLHISVPLSEVPEAQVGNYFILSEMPGEFLIIQKPDNTFYFLCSRECDIVRICESFDWYIVSKDAFNDRLCIGIGLADKESIDGEVYRVQDEATLSLWRDILRFTFDSDFVRRFFPYNTRFKGKMRIDGALCFYIHDYYPTRCKGIAVEDRKTSNLVFRFKEGQQAALVAKIFSLCIARMPFYKEKAANAVLIPIPAATRERNAARFARFCSLLSHRLKITDGFRATWIREDREQMKGTHGLDKLSNLIFHPVYFQGRDVFLVDDIVSTGENFTQMKRRLMQLGANSVTGLFLGRTVKTGKE